MAILFGLNNLKACELHGKVIFEKEIYPKVKELTHLMILEIINLIIFWQQT